MKVKRLVQFGFQTLTVMSLLFTSISSVSAGGEKGENDGDNSNRYTGEVSVSVSKELPYPFVPKSGIQPLAVQPLPGGGTATATAGLSWSQVQMDGIARSSLSSNTVSIYYICARVEYVLMNGIPQGGTNNKCGNRGAGGSITATKSVYTLPNGKTWQVNTRHSFDKPGYAGWYPAVQVGPCTVQGSSCN